MKKLNRLALAVAVAGMPLMAQADTSPKAVITHYADMAEAAYTDALQGAKELHQKITALLDNPSEQTLQQAKESWIKARVPYMQTEAYRFGNAIVDDWEGRVNAWPLDEGLIDYVDSQSYGSESEENPWYSANIIANPTLKLGNRTLDSQAITAELLEELHEVDDVEANVATGYHAIEFLLWGQDLNGTNPGAGKRPATDFSLQDCTGGNCERRREYLQVATELLVHDLKEMADNWDDSGAAREQLMEKGEQGGLATILTGMGSLSYGEMAGERTKLGLMLHDPEEEHDCFSDNTHASHYYDAKGIKNVYLGEYVRTDGSKVSGPSMSDLVREKDAALDKQLRNELDATEAAMQTMVDEAAKGNTFDVLIGSGNKIGNQQVQKVVDSLTTQTRSIEKAINLLDLEGIELEGSDSLDNPAAVTQG